MNTQTPVSQPDLGFVFSEFLSFQRAMALKTAVGLDLFTHVVRRGRNGG